MKITNLKGIIALSKDSVIRKLNKNLHNVKEKLPKWPHIYINAQFEIMKHQHQTTFETLKYLQQTMY